MSKTRAEDQARTSQRPPQKVTALYGTCCFCDKAFFAGDSVISDGDVAAHISCVTSMQDAVLPALERLCAEAKR